MFRVFKSKLAAERRSGDVESEALSVSPSTPRHTQTPMFTPVISLRQCVAGGDDAIDVSLEA